MQKHIHAVYTGVQGKAFKLWYITEGGKFSYEFEQVWGPGFRGVFLTDPQEIKAFIKKHGLRRNTQ